MIIYRPIAPLTAGTGGLRSALAAMALTAVLGTSTWDAEQPGPSAIPGEAPGTSTDEAGRNRH